MSINVNVAGLDAALQELKVKLNSTSLQDHRGYHRGDREIAMEGSGRFRLEIECDGDNVRAKFLQSTFSV